MRKKTNALRRRYQRTTSNEALREGRKTQYNKAKAEYQAAVRKEKMIGYMIYEIRDMIYDIRYRI
jgi:hypothetical protein